MEHHVKGYGASLAQVDALECATYGHGPCLNREGMRERVMSGGTYDYCYCANCCVVCPKLSSCKYACTLLADKVKQLKADVKAQKQQEHQAREEQERSKVDQIKALWKRFGEARAAAGKSVEEIFEAGGFNFSEDDAKKLEEMEHLEGTFDLYTELPYGYVLEIDDIQSLLDIADLLGVSLDYLLCRTDDPAGFAPQPEGQLVFNGWMPGGLLPRTPCDVVADFDVGDGLISRMVCWFDGKAFRFSNAGEKIEADPVRWMMLPPVVSESDTGEETA